MQRWTLLGALLGGGALVAGGLTACTGGESGAPTESPASAEKASMEADLTKTWAVGFADVSTWEAYQTPGWITYVTKRDLRRSAEQLGAKSARSHAEAAVLFRQAALLSANAAIQTYAETPQETDPVGVAHLLTIAYALQGDLDEARKQSAKLDGVDDVTAAWHAPWKAWLAGDASWPPDLSGLPIELPPQEAGSWPTVEDAPHYAMPVQGAGDHAQDMGDPGALVALALWHDGLAKKLAGDPVVVDLYTARYRLPIEGPVEGKGALPMSFLYASDFLVPEDAAFMADVTWGKGAAAVAAHTGSSVTAQLAEQARVDGKIDAEKAVDVAVALRDGIRDASKGEGEIQRHHRWFADMAYVGLVRNLALLAEVEGDRDTSGKLRILARDQGVEHASDPQSLMALAAWDASNRYPSRAQEIIHQHAKTYPSLEAARFGLDVLALRVSRERVETPGM